MRSRLLGRLERGLAHLWRIVPLPVLIILVLMFAWWSELPRLEGSLLPVNKNTQLIIGDRTNGSLEITIQFNKIRSCDYKHFDLYKLTRSGFRERLLVWPSIVKDPADMPDNLSRPIGSNTVVYDVRTPLMLDPKLLEIVVTHKCHPFWLTRTRMWPR